jgi:hypothetical protein
MLVHVPGKGKVARYRQSVVECHDDNESEGLPEHSVTEQIYSLE